MMSITKQWSVTIEFGDRDPFTFYVNDNHSQNVLSLLGKIGFDKEIKSIKINEKLPVNPQISGNYTTVAKYDPSTGKYENT